MSTHIRTGLSTRIDASSEAAAGRTFAYIIFGKCCKGGSCSAYKRTGEALHKAEPRFGTESKTFQGLRYYT